MKRIIRTFLVAMLLIVAIATLPQLASAQTECPGLIINNNSRTDLDGGRICSAAQPFIEQGLQVFVFATNMNPQTEDEWWTIRDEVEIGWDIYNPNDDTFSKNAVAVEFTTVTSHPWGQDIAFGERLFGTPLDDDRAIDGIEGILKNNVSTGDLTSAVSIALTESYSTAFPPVMVPTQEALREPTNNQQEPQPQSVFENEDSKFNIGQFLIGAIIFAAGMMVFLFVIVPIVKNIRYRIKLNNQIKRIQHRVSKLLNSASKLLEGDDIDQIAPYQLWFAYGGKSHTEHDKRMRSMLKELVNVVDRVFELYHKLESLESPYDMAKLQDLVRRWEILYKTVTGNSAQILSMTEKEQQDLLNPLLVIERDKINSKLLAQIEQAFPEDEPATLRIQLLMINPDEVNEEGILGYIDQIKGMISQLREAQDQGPQTLKEAEVMRQQMQPYAGNHGLRPFAFPDSFINEARKAIKKELWLTAKEAAENAIAAMSKLPEVMGEMSAGLKARDKNFDALKTIRAEGYHEKNVVTAALEETETDLSEAVKAINSGDYQKAIEFIHEMVADSKQALDLMSAQVELHKKNQRELASLQKQLEYLKRFYQEDASAAWQGIQNYPRTNWVEIKSHYQEAEKALGELIRDVTNIEKQNSMQLQNFVLAEQLILEAFSNLTTTKNQLEEVAARLATVKRIEQTIDQTLASAEKEIQKAKARRDKDDKWIDAEVDRQISEADEKLSLAITYAKQREFTLAANNVTTAMNLATQAYSSAEAQATAIAKLYQNLETSRSDADQAVGAALQEQSRLLPAAQKATTSALCNSARDQLQAAHQKEVEIGGEDRSLQKKLRRAISAYEQAQEAAKKALSQIKSDRREYQDWINKANSAIQDAESSISHANQYVNNFDASQAGRHALGRARSTVPNQAQDGESIDSLRRKVDSAEEANRHAQQALREAQSRIAQNQADRRRRETTIRNNSSMGFSSGRGTSSFGSSSRRGGRPSMGSSRRR